MKTLSLPNMVKVVLTTIIIVFLTTFGYSQNSQIELNQLIIPDSAALNAIIPVSGYFKNTGTTVFTGKLGIHVQVQDNPSSGVGMYYTADIYEIDTYTLQPGEEVFFSTQINIVPSIFNVASKDVIIIFPRIGNAINTLNYYSKEVEVVYPEISNGN